MEREGWTARILSGLMVVGLLVAVGAFLLSQSRDGSNVGVALWDSEEPWKASIAREKQQERLSAGFISELEQVVVPAFEFEELPLRECLAEINALLKQHELMEEINFEFSDEETAMIPVTLSLPEAPLSEVIAGFSGGDGLRYHRFMALPDRTISIHSYFHSIHPLEEGWFHVPKGILDVQGKGPLDAKDALERYGVTFFVGATAIYYPEVDLLWVRNELHQMELIEALCEIKPPTMWQRLVRWHIWDSPWSRWVRPVDPFGP